MFLAPREGTAALAAAVAARVSARADVRLATPVQALEPLGAGWAVDGEPFDAVVCSLVLCSVDDPDDVLRQLFSLVRPGGELRFLEHVGSAGLRGRLQRFADATIWPRLMGNCHTHRDTEASIIGAGFEVHRARREPAMPAWFPTPVAEYTIGRATKPAAN